jgi:hypothetical protein
MGRMLGRKTYTQEELDSATATVTQQLRTYRALVAGAGAAAAVVDDFEVRFLNNMVLVLDRLFVHRLRVVTGKDGNALNEVELLADSLMNNKGVFRGNNVVKLVPDESILKLQYGDPVRLTVDDFERLSSAFLAEIDGKFVSAG